VSTFLDRVNASRVQHGLAPVASKTELVVKAVLGLLYVLLLTLALYCAQHQLAALFHDTKLTYRQVLALLVVVLVIRRFLRK